MSDQELVTGLLERIAELAAVGADALQEVPGLQVTVTWLTEAATGFTMAAQDTGTLSRIALADEDRGRIREALGEEPFLGDGEWPR